MFRKDAGQEDHEMEVIPLFNKKLILGLLLISQFAAGCCWHRCHYRYYRYHYRHGYPAGYPVPSGVPSCGCDSCSTSFSPNYVGSGIPMSPIVSSPSSIAPPLSDNAPARMPSSTNALPLPSAPIKGT